jgi:hypothetical protein
MIVCGCGSIMRTKKIGAVVEEHLENGGPYKKWMGDAKECRKCGAVVVFISPTQEPIAHHFEEPYNKYKTEYHAT